jgi:hypothetical protein
MMGLDDFYAFDLTALKTAKAVWNYDKITTRNGIISVYFFNNRNTFDRVVTYNPHRKHIELEPLTFSVGGFLVFDNSIS